MAPVRTAAGRFGNATQTPLAQIMEQAVLPRLRADPVGRLVQLCLRHDGAAAIAFAGILQAQGLEPEQVINHVLVPAARRLGAMWVDDTCSFTDVTIGVARLQAAQRSLAAVFVGPPRLASAGRILLLPAPGEQHVFGLSIVADHFRRAGWEATCAIPGTADSNRAALALLRRTRPHVLAVTLACDQRIAPAAALIRTLRAAAPDLVVLAGGSLLATCPDLAARVGAQATAADAQGAVRAAVRLARPAAADQRWAALQHAHPSE